MSHSPSTNCVFEESWWLDATAGTSWDAVAVHEGGRLVARLPFSIKRRYGMRILSQPALTQTLGPWLLDVGAGYTKQLAREKDLFTKLIKQLPKFDIYRQSFHPSITNWLPFYWQGFAQTTKYTYTIDLTEAEAVIAARFVRQHRSGIRKAESRVAVELTDDLEVFLEVNTKTYAAQQRRPPYADDYVRTLDAALRDRGKRFILIARDRTDGAVHAGVYVAGDSRRMYLLMSGVDPEFRDSRAGSLIVWEAIKEAKRRGVAVFDFEGSMMESVEVFERGFGSTQTPYHAISRHGTLGQIADSVYALRSRG